MRPKTEEQKRARELRSMGWSLREIASELGVALSSVSTWVRDIPGPHPGKPTTRSLSGGVPIRTITVVTDPSQLRRCSKCRLWKPLTAFNRNGDDRQWYCRDCFRAYFAKRGDLHREQVSSSLRERREKARQLVEERRLEGCVDCGVTKSVVLEFDHLDDKSGDITRMMWGGRKADRLADELALCDVVCVNCHKHRTYSRMPHCWRLDPLRIETHPRMPDGAKRNMVYVRGVLNTSECVDCGLRDPVVLEFDHRHDKLGNVTIMARDGCSLRRLQDEIAKCDIRCGNCHRRRTILERRALRSDPPKLNEPP